MVSKLIVVIAIRSRNALKEKIFDENLGLIYDDYPKEYDVVDEVEFINKLPPIEQFVLEEILFCN